MFSAAVAAGSAHLLREAFEFALLQLETQRAEGVASQSIQDLANEIAAQLAALTPVSLVESGVTAGLGLFLVIGAFGICRRSRAALRFTQAVVVLKAGFVGFTAWYLYDSYVPEMQQLATLVEELIGLVGPTGGQGSGRDPFAGFRSFANGGLETSALWMTILTALPVALALWIAFSPTVRRWCSPPAGSSVASPSASR